MKSALRPADSISVTCALWSGRRQRESGEPGAGAEVGDGRGLAHRGELERDERVGQVDVDRLRMRVDRGGGVGCLQALEEGGELGGRAGGEPKAGDEGVDGGHALRAVLGGRTAVAPALAVTAAGAARARCSRRSGRASSARRAAAYASTSGVTRPSITGRTSSTSARPRAIHWKYDRPPWW